MAKNLKISISALAIASLAWIIGTQLRGESITQDLARNFCALPPSFFTAWTFLALGSNVVGKRQGARRLTAISIWALFGGALFWFVSTFFYSLFSMIGSMLAQWKIFAYGKDFYFSTTTVFLSVALFIVLEHQSERRVGKAQRARADDEQRR